MKIWKVILGFLGLVGGLFAAGATKNKKVTIIIVDIIDNKNWLAPLAKPTAIIKNKYTNSSGSLIAALNLTIDNAPTKPSDKAKENFITVITRVVMIASGTNVSEKYSLSLRVLETLMYVYFIT